MQFTLTSTNHFLICWRHLTANILKSLALLFSLAVSISLVLSILIERSSSPISDIWVDGKRSQNPSFSTRKFITLHRREGRPNAQRISLLLGQSCKGDVISNFLAQRATTYKQLEFQWFPPERKTLSNGATDANFNLVTWHWCRNLVWLHCYNSYALYFLPEGTSAFRH